MDKKYISEIVFGILSGAGAIFIAFILSMLLSLTILPDSYFIIVFFVIYFFIFILTLIFFAKGLFRKAYLISTGLTFLVLYFTMKILTPTNYI